MSCQISCPPSPSLPANLPTTTGRPGAARNLRPRSPRLASPPTRRSLFTRLTSYRGAARLPLLHPNKSTPPLALPLPPSPPPSRRRRHLPGQLERAGAPTPRQSRAAPPRSRRGRQGSGGGSCSRRDVVGAVHGLLALAVHHPALPTHRRTPVSLRRRRRAGEVS